MTIQIIREPVSRAHLLPMAKNGLGDMVKAVVDIDRGLMAIGGELHADEEALLLEQGSRQEFLWGINLFPAVSDESWIEFDSMINLRPAQGNRSRGVDSAQIREKLRQIVDRLIKGVA